MNMPPEVQEILTDQEYQVTFFFFRSEKDAVGLTPLQGFKAAEKKYTTNPW